MTINLFQKYKEMLLESNITVGDSLVGSNGTKYKIGNSYIDIQHSNLNFAPRKQSVVDFHVDEKDRNKGIGTALLKHAMTKHDDIGAQVSSPASVKVFHKLGFRNPEMKDGSFEDHENLRKHQSSVFMARN